MKEYKKCITIDEVWDMLFDSYPKDMENFDTMTENQAYRLIKKFWEKLEEITYPKQKPQEDWKEKLRDFFNESGQNYPDYPNGVEGFVEELLLQSRKEDKKEIERLESVVIGQKQLIASLDKCLELKEKEIKEARKRKRSMRILR
jgi:hypothetical protein